MRYDVFIVNNENKDLKSFGKHLSSNLKNIIVTHLSSSENGLYQDLEL